MHRIIFSAKRVYWRTVAWGKARLEYLGLTPARFDLLYWLVMRRGHWAWQSQIWKALGVRPMVVSRMIRALESMGLLTRFRDEIDKRQLLVFLTREGRRLMKRAIRDLIVRGVAKQKVQESFAKSGRERRSARWRNTTQEVLRHKERCHRELVQRVEHDTTVMSRLGERAQVIYRYHPRASAIEQARWSYR